MDGGIYKSVGKYARAAVLYAFEQAGGPDALAVWAEKNPDEFYTKLFPKIIAKESDVNHHRSLDDLMDVLDGDYEVESVEDAEVLPPPTFAAQAPEPAPVDPDFDQFDIDDLVQFDD